VALNAAMRSFGVGCEVTLMTASVHAGLPSLDVSGEDVVVRGVQETLCGIAVYLYVQVIQALCAGTKAS
jgi:hypothetical protein